MAENLVEGQTTPIQQQLLLGGVAVPGGIAGMTVELILYDRAGNAAPTSGDAAIVTAATAIVKYTPDAGDFRAVLSPYAARWKVTNGSEIAFFPSAEPDVWMVRR